MITLTMRPDELAAKIIHGFYLVTREFIYKGDCNRDKLSNEDYKNIVNGVTRGEEDKIRKKYELYRDTLKCVRRLWRCEMLSQRLSAFLSITVQEGIESAITFYMSKAERTATRNKPGYSDVYRLIREAFNGRIDSAAAQTDAHRLSNECDDAYTLSLAMIAFGLKKLNVFDLEPCTLEDLIECVRKAIAEKRFVTYNDIIIDFLVHLKRFADALYKW